MSSGEPTTTPSVHSSFKQALTTAARILVVISVIGFLGGFFIPTKRSGPRIPIVRAKNEISQLEQAIVAYKANYSRWPMTSNALRHDSSDFTYGTFGVDMQERITVINPRPRHQANNSEIVTILMAVPHPAYNPDHTNNPLKKEFLNPKRSTEDGKPGLGPKDNIYRDPWGMPYIISIDLNGDGMTQDAFYSSAKVSQSPTGGINGLRSLSGSGPNEYGLKGSVMIWSFGPDRKADPNIPANEGVNADNILSWK